MTEFTQTITMLQQRILVLREYCRMKLDAGDWHGVSDAANDLRELEAQLQLLTELRGTPNE